MQLDPKFDPKVVEHNIREYMNSINLRQLLESELKDKERMGFVEGPPTMNGEPHVGHLRGRVMKDLWYRFSTLRKFNVIFRAGWDTQGLPVELQVEKELGLSGSKAENLKSVGIEKIVEECKKLVHRYNEKWVESDRLLGISFDHENAYWTYRDEYIEREWKYLKRAWEQDILVEGYRVVAYCPSCQTSLSHAEVSQGYEVVEDPSLYYKVKVVDEDAYLIIWTTMPFTVVTDEMVGVNPDAEYLYVKVRDENWIVAKDRLEPLMTELKITDFTISKKVNGEELDGKKYTHPLLSEISGLMEIADKVHIVVAEKFVDINTGSGLVHLSPANGAEDFQIASEHKLPIFNPIDEQVKFTEQAGIFAGLFVRDADRKVVDALKEKNAIVRIGRIKHEYPTCWRSHHKLVWIARREYFNMIDRIGERALEAAENVEYFYSEPKNRFVGIIREQVPWCVSRERVWGAPLPIWVCSNCKHKTALFSRKEIVEKASKLPDGKDFELHRPWIDRVIIKCEECGSDSYREQFVLDTWHNSGAAPYSSFTDEEYDKFVPVPFLTEGIDQTRGWAYTLLIENVIMSGKGRAPFKAFLFQGHVLDKNGNKMSKSLGNVIDGFELLRNNAVDLVRFYFMWKSSPIDALNFSIEEMKTRTYQVLSTLYYLHVYFGQNSEYDLFDVNKKPLERMFNEQKHTEKWLLSRLQKLISTVTESYKKCRYHEAARALENFIITDLSQTYVPLTRIEIWDDTVNQPRKFTIYATLAYALITVDILLHPICPFITEYLYRNCFLKTKPILLDQWPTKQNQLVDDDIERSFEKLTNIVSLASAARMKASMKRRWPLKHAYIYASKEDFAILEPVKELLMMQLNVGHVESISLEATSIGGRLLEMKSRGIPIEPKLFLKRSNIAPKVKADINRVQSEFSSARHVDILQALESEGRFNLHYDSKEVIITNDDVEISYETSKGFVVAERDNNFVVLNTERDSELMVAGLVRDLARRLQSLRKQRGYNPTRLLNFAYISGLDDEILELLESKLDEIAFLVRVKKVELVKEAREGIKWSEDEIDGKPIHLSVE